MRVLTYVVAPEDDGRAVRSVVPRRFSLGTHAFRRLKAQGGILVDGRAVHTGYILRAGEVVELRMQSSVDHETEPGLRSARVNGMVAPEHGTACSGDAVVPVDSASVAESASVGAQAVCDQARSLDGLPASHIRYRDDDLLIVCKGAPLATLPSIHQRTGTLREQLAAMLGQNEKAFVYHPVNRLDKGTSGLLCVALHAHAQRLLAAQLHTGAFVREYLAVTQGMPPEREGVIDAPIARSGQGARRHVAEGGQRAVTHYRVEHAANGRALLRLRLDTGRTHQIRVHLSHIGCPIVGDYLYGEEIPSLKGRFALHSASLSLTHPITGKTLRVDEPLPDELARLLEE